MEKLKRKESKDEDRNLLVEMLLIAVTIIVALLVAYYISTLFSAVRGTTRRRSRSVLLVGLTGSGKTTLFAQLVARKRVEVRTSMEPNRGVMRLASAAENEDPTAGSESSGVTIIDFPGHRRLRESLMRALEEVKKVVFVVDAVTIQDPHEGAEAVAELIVAVLSSTEFFGVESVLIACTKRDELTSYSAKAVQKLLEKEITHCLSTRHGGVQRLESIVNASGVAVGSGNKSRRNAATHGCRAHELSLDEARKFSFANFQVPVQFVDISSFVGPEDQVYNVEPVREFATS